MAMTAAQYLTIQTALGRDTIQVAEEIRKVLDKGGRVSEGMWREFLARMTDHSPAIMDTAYGRAFRFLVEEKIKNDNGNAGLRRRGGGFPSNRGAV
jgi:hypothetical protein